MARRSVHYEAAFEDYLRSRGWPYLPVDEHRKAIFGGARVKTFDFLVYPPRQRPWLADVKRRKFPYDYGKGRHYWENWVTQEDLDGLGQWQKVFGEEFEPVFVFAYWLTDIGPKDPSDSVHLFRGESYAFLKTGVCDYRNSARQRSPKWGTVSVPRQAFRSMVRPLAN